MAIFSFLGINTALFNDSYGISTTIIEEIVYSSLPSVDTRITTNPVDIVLYSSNQLVIFYDSNIWYYTKLGHINLSKSELTDLLGDEDVVITFSLK